MIKPTETESIDSLAQEFKRNYHVIDHEKHVENISEIDVDKVFKRLLALTGEKNLNDLSLKNGYNKDWASNCILNEVIPWDLCLKMRNTYHVSLDDLIFENNQK